MSIDLSQFHQVFFEESFEGLDVMEASLMELQPDDVDSETINTIFRSAHSIKGGSATFGFSVVADFTHVLETLLDEVRDNKRGISQEDVDLYLQSVDCMRALLEALQDGRDPDTETSLALQKKFERMLEGADLESSCTDDSLGGEAFADKGSFSHWAISFHPGPELLKKGNDPLRIFRELAEGGALSSEVNVSSVPAFSSLDPESCYLNWQLSLASSSDDQARIDEAFEWVIDESLLTIEASQVTGVADIDANNDQNNSDEKLTLWNIYFKPNSDVLRSGNEPWRMFRELSEIVSVESVQVSADVSGIPSFQNIEPEVCYAAWNISVSGGVTREDIDEVFEWVVDESVIKISTAENLPHDNAEKLIPDTNSNKEPLSGIDKVEEAQGGNKEPIAGSDPAKNVKSAAKKSSSETSSIRVGIDKVDSLINMVGELVITQSMLGQLGTEFDMAQLPRLIEGLSQLEHNTRELQESVMRIRMLPISFAFSRFPRMVRDLSRRLEKEVDLQLLGETTELDKTVMEKIGDPLVHLVRNSVDHGIELPAEREAAGKDPMGTIVLNAYHQGGNVVIEITDDGKGMGRDKIIAKAVEKNLISDKDSRQLSDVQVFDLIFQPGFSTAATVSDVSGRGVGMDVVRRNIQDLNGTVELSSKEGAGSTVTIRLPLTLAILDGQLVRIGCQTYIFPLVSIIESMQISADKVSKVAGGCDVFQLRNEYVPIVRLYDIFNIEPDSKKIEESLLVVVESDGEKVGVVVDDLEAQQQVVIKSLEQNYQRIEGVSGATILGNGTVALILDVPGLVKIAGIKHLMNTNVTSLGRGHEMQSQMLSVGG